MNATLPSLESLVSDPAYPRLREQIVESTGLTYYIGKDAELAEHIRHRLAIIDAHDSATYLALLLDRVRGPSELDSLVEQVTIGETYFFRHQEHFDALRDVVLPDLIARNGRTRRLRVWCAGCADGPEPYSLAILLKRDLARQLAGWEVTILGTDINRRSLARAREGKFEQWAFRSTSEEIRQSCFHKDGTKWRIAAEYQESVSFRYHNLAEDSFPSPVNNLCCFDLIVCRNVMIYFGTDRLRSTVRKFHDSMVAGAWLLVGPSEPNMTCFSSFRPVNAPGVTLYQRPDESTPANVAETIAETPVTPLPLFELPAYEPHPELLATANGGVESAPSTLADAKCHADRGDWASATQCCDQLLKQDNLDATVHFYRALVLEQTKRRAEAEKSLRRAIYLDRQYVLAHYHLGLTLQSRGDSRQAARSFENALDLLRPRCDADIFAEADGITAGELKKLANMHLQILREKE